MVYVCKAQVINKICYFSLFSDTNKPFSNTYYTVVMLYP